MSPLASTAGIALLQAVFSYVIILASPGNGSFAGLIVMLMAVFGIPLSAIINFSILHGRRRNPEPRYAARVLYVSLALPVAQIALLVLVSVFRL